MGEGGTIGLQRKVAKLSDDNRELRETLRAVVEALLALDPGDADALGRLVDWAREHASGLGGPRPPVR